MKRSRKNTSVKISDVSFRALDAFAKSESAQKMLIAAMQHRGISLPTLTFVELGDGIAHVITVQLKKQQDLIGSPKIDVISAVIDKGQIYGENIFISDQALLDFDEEVLLAKIESGEIGEGTCILANASVSEDSILGRNVIVGQNCKIFGSVIGDDTAMGENVWIGPKVEIESCTLIGRDTSLSGTITVGVSEFSDELEPSLVIIGDNCAIDDCSVEKGTIIGGHCLVEKNPSFSGLVPDGATVSATATGFSVELY
jgi:NDP-sugar pyrophosphorylase family protein